MLTEGLPQAGPHTRHLTDGVEYDYSHSLMWALWWSLQQNTVVIGRALGNDKIKMPADRMPRFPWSMDNKNTSLGGSLGDKTQGEVLDFLDSL